MRPLTTTSHPLPRKFDSKKVRLQKQHETARKFDSKNSTKVRLQNIKQREPQQKYRLGTISNTKKNTGGLKPVFRVSQRQVHTLLN